jgi:hypothetical protein
MSKIRLSAALAAIACLAGTASAGGNFLNNAGFENDLGFDFSNLSNWNGFFGGPAGTYLEAFNTTGATPRSGAKALVTTIRGVEGVTDGFGAFTGHVQFVSNIVVGATYEYSVWARANQSLNGIAEFRIEWQDSNGLEISRNNVQISNLLTTQYQHFSLSDVAPIGAARAAVVVAVASPAPFVPDPLADTSVAWDDASLTIVPAPAAAAVLGFAGLFAGRRRR